MSYAFIENLEMQNVLACKAIARRYRFGAENDHQSIVECILEVAFYV